MRGVDTQPETLQGEPCLLSELDETALICVTALTLKACGSLNAQCM